jgi:hypothetical protein
MENLFFDVIFKNGDHILKHALSIDMSKLNDDSTLQDIQRIARLYVATQAFK